MVEALLFGHKAALPIIEAQEKLRTELNRSTKREFAKPVHDAEFTAKVRSHAWDADQQGLPDRHKMERYAELSKVKKETLVAAR